MKMHLIYYWKSEKGKCTNFFSTERVINIINDENQNIELKGSNIPDNFQNETSLTWYAGITMYKMFYVELIDLFSYATCLNTYVSISLTVVW